MQNFFFHYLNSGKKYLIDKKIKWIMGIYLINRKTIWIMGKYLINRKIIWLIERILCEWQSGLEPVVSMESISVSREIELHTILLRFAPFKMYFGSLLIILLKILWERYQFTGQQWLLWMCRFGMSFFSVYFPMYFFVSISQIGFMCNLHHYFRY